MKTKKFFALLLALAMLLALAACGNAPADTNETNTNTGAKRKLVVANWQSYATDSDYGAAHFAELYDCEVEHYRCGLHQPALSSAVPERRCARHD